MFAKLSDYKIFENKPSENYKAKSNEAYDESPRKKIIFSFRKIVIIIWIKFINNGHHTQICERKHQVADRNKNACQTIFRSRES